MNDCLFCRIVRGEIPARKVFEDELVIAFHDINPARPRHLLIVPKRHIPTLNDIGEADVALVGGMFPLAARLAREAGCAESGYRTVFNCNRDAQQSVFHIHLHVLGGRGFTWPPG